MEYEITLLHGDGIGPEVTQSAKMCVEEAGKTDGFSVCWDVQPAGAGAMKKYGSPLPEQTLESIRKNKVALKGPITTPIGRGFRSINVELRQKLDLFANVRPARTFDGTKSRYSNVDLVVIRENTEDLYEGIEFRGGSKDAKDIIGMVKKRTGKLVREGSALALKPISSFGSRRIAKFAFDYAKAKGRSRITAVHKANIMKYTDGLFLRSAQAIAKGYKSIGFDSMIVDDMCMQLVVKPERYDMLLCPNLYGDILSDLCAGLVGGLGMAPGGNIGKSTAVFEPVHGSAPKHAGKNDVNPAACILASAMMLEHIGEHGAAARIEGAVAKVIREGRSVTYDLARGKPVGTKEMTAQILRNISK